jgi:eukaryotic-like serine/threonine-protein kinase
MSSLRNQAEADLPAKTLTLLSGHVMIGKTVSHYKILEKLGEGGMGVVYKAEDTKLERLVALKFLPHHLTSSEAEQARFLQEAKAAAALNHPNVCSVIDIQEGSGQQFIVMEYVEGVTLHHKAPIGKVDDAIEYAIHIGEALQMAHRDPDLDNIRNEPDVVDLMKGK